MARTMPHTGQQNATTHSPWIAGLVAAGISAVLNAAIFLIGRAADLIPSSVEVSSPTGEGPLTIGPVIVMSVLPTIVAVLVYVLVQRIASNPARTFRVIGGILLVLSFLMPFGISDVPLKMALTLNLMHLVTGLAILTLIPSAGATRADGHR